MSKVDGPRAIRDARYAAYRASLAAGAATAKAAPAPSEGSASPSAAGLGQPGAEGSAVETAPARAASDPAPARVRATGIAPVIAFPGSPAGRPEPSDTAQLFADPAPEVEGPALCGHRNMGGKSCSRPSGHSEKNHRYA